MSLDIVVPAPTSTICVITLVGKSSRVKSDSSDIFGNCKSPPKLEIFLSFPIFFCPYLNCSCVKLKFKGLKVRRAKE